jgi:hypothetical protein
MNVRLAKIKRPGGAYVFSVEALVDDKWGAWLAAPRGTAWSAPHDAGTLPFDVMILIGDGEHWVAWWVDDPADRRIEIDVCLPAERTPMGWSYVDLELDPVRHGSGLVEVQDRDEFAVACREAWIDPAIAPIAEATARSLEHALTVRQEPFGEVGWQRLVAAKGRRASEQ